MYNAVFVLVIDIDLDQELDRRMSLYMTSTSVREYKQLWAKSQTDVHLLYITKNANLLANCMYTI
jgi:hypothetical protein